MKKVDVFNHIFPTRYWDAMIAKAGEHKDLGKRVRSVPMLMDLDERFRVMDLFDDYVQILSIAAPPLEVMFTPEDAAELAVVANDGMAELCQRYPDRFPGFVAHLALNNPDAAVAETHRTVNDLGALGVHIFTNVKGRALDNPEYSRCSRRRTNSMCRCGCTRRAVPRCPTTATKSARATRSGGPLASPTRPRRRRPAWCFPVCSTGCPTSRSLPTTWAA